jgi:SNF2 family DNA or RNA helicase
MFYRLLILDQRMNSSSTLENWTREFQRFAPSLSCQTYYGSKDERRELRHQLKEQAARTGGWEVLITTYNLAQGDEMDRKFFYKMNWEVSGDFPYVNSTNSSEDVHLR